MVLQAEKKPEKETPEVSAEKTPDVIANPYKISWFDKIPFWVKAVLIKYWAIGAIYFFFVMGITTWMNVTYNPLIQMLVVGIAMGFMNDFITDNILDAIETSKKEAHYWWIFKNAKIYSLFINLAFALAWSYATGFLCAYLVTITPANSFGVWQEPLTFAVIGLAIELAAIGLKDLIVYLWQKMWGPCL
jgi:hypothetical protein